MTTPCETSVLYPKHATQNGPKICDNEEEEHAWLVEIGMPADLYMCLGEYTSLAIQL
ncbi:hypothetical protein AHAS_Ahas15G0195100 [Arachis hypogaea]